jgi:hypothetical protein
LFDAITFVVPAKEQHVDYYQIVKEQPIVRMLEPEVACASRGKLLSVLHSRLEHGTRISTHRMKRSDGGGERDRTDDPLLAKQVLSQLSYTPGVCGWWVWLDSNQRPPPYQDGALTS